MTIRTIAVALCSPTEAGWLAPAACEFARVHDAHLIGVIPSEPVVVYGGVGIEPMLMQDLLSWRDEETRKIGEIFTEAARLSGVASELRSDSGSLFGSDAYMASCLRSADLVVIGTSADIPFGTADDRMRQLIVRHSGRPVLVLPRDITVPARPERILIGWSDTPEATRAAHDGLALAAPGASVDLLSVRPAEEGDTARRLVMDSRHDFAAALDRHGFKVNLIDRDAESGATGETLLDAARETGAQLVIAGAFGHSRVYDFVIGAVTSHLMEKADVPVLLSH